MSFNTVALYNYPLVIPVLRSEYSEPFRPRHKLASTVAQGTNSQVRHGVLGIPRLDATSNVQPRAFSPGYACLCNDADIRNDWALAAKGHCMPYFSAYLRYVGLIG